MRKSTKVPSTKVTNESVTNCNQLKMVSPKDEKMRLADVADMEQMFRLIQSTSLGGQARCDAGAFSVGEQKTRE